MISRRLHLAGAAAALLLIALAEGLGAQGRARPAAAASTAPPARTPSANWLSDKRELAIGDIITLFVDDAVIASSRKSQSGRDNTGRDMSVAVSPPGNGAAIRGSFGAGKRTNSEQSGDMSRNTALRTTVSVRVIARTPDGAYRVKGTRALNIDKNSQQIDVEGILRSQDVSPQNEADGNRLADATIIVKAKGTLGKTRGGFIGRIVGMIWP